jgi:alpha-1,6-mannosyltransferase
MIGYSTRNSIGEVERTAPPLQLFSLVALGALSAAIYFWARDLHRFTQWIAAYIALYLGQLLLYAVSCWTIFRFRSPNSSSRVYVLAAIFVFACVFRAELVTQRPYLSSDVYRYVWDGRVQSSGFNPYLYTPNADELKPLRDEAVFPLINPGDRDWLSPYPPMAQVVFWGVYSVAPGVTGLKVAMSIFDMLAVALAMIALARSGLDPARAIVLAWHPLLILESAHSGHVESLFILMLSLALVGFSFRKPLVAGGSLALATLVKFYPALIVPGFLAGTGGEDDSVPKRVWRALFNRDTLQTVAAFALLLVVGYIPFAGAGSKTFAFAQEYLRDEGFVQSGARYFPLVLIRRVVPFPTWLFVCAAVLVIGIVAVWALIQRKRNAVEVSRCALALIGTYLLVTTPRYAWYYVWLLPFLCFVSRVAWLYLASAAALLYLVWYTPLVYPNVPLWLGAAIYGPAVAALILDSKRVRATER